MINQYRMALSEAMDDFELTTEEIDALQHIAGLLAMTSAEIKVGHEEHLRDLIALQAEDGIFTWTEQQLAKTTSVLLGIADGKLDELLKQHDAKIEGKIEATPVEGFAGLTICFTGDFEAIPMSREEVEDFALGIGLTPHPRVTKKVDILVCRDPLLKTSKLTKAADYGTIIIDQQTFLAMAGAAPAAEGAITDLLARVQSRRHAATTKKPTTPRAKPASTQTSGDRLLWCEGGQHEWTRPSQRGRLPVNCPEHL